MRQTAQLLSLLSLLLATALHLGAQAQTTAFAYKGHLSDGTQPANGFYELQFRLADAGTGGSYLGPVLTPPPVWVSNGLFIVSLDFGSAVFDGSARWLEVGVRTNGDTSFTALSPRQEIAATPYAIFSANAATAASAASLSGAVAASQVTGTLSAGQLPASLSGTFVGDISGATNLLGTSVQARTLSSNQLDNATWAALVKADLDSYSNVNRYAWARTAAKLRSNTFTTFLVYGNGWAYGNGPSGAQPMTDVYKLLTAYHPEAGRVIFAGADATFNPSSQSLMHNNDAQWPFTYFLLSSPNDTVTAWNGYVSDVQEIYYIRTAAGGTFKVQSSTDNVNYTDVPGFTSVSALRPGNVDVGAVCCWTNPAVANVYLRVVCTGSGGIPILGLGHRNQALMAAGGVRLAEMFEVAGPNTSSVQMGIICPLFQCINPDMIMNIGGQDIYPWRMLYGMYDLFRTNTPNADVVLGGMFPMTTHAASPPFPTVDASIVQFNALTAAYCVSNGWAYFDGHTPFGGYDNMVARGFSGGDPSNPHLVTEGYARYNEFLWAWLNLLNTPMGPVGSASPAAYTSSQEYTSPEIGLTPRLATTVLPHNFGAVPKLFRAVLRCKADDAPSGLTAGAEIPVELTRNMSSGGVAYAVAATPTQFLLKGPGSTSKVRVGTATTASAMSNFRLVIYATQ